MDTFIAPNIMPGPLFFSGGYYDPSSWWGGQASSGALAAAREHDVPVWIPRGGVAIDRLVLEIVAGGGVGKLARVYIRQPNENKLPGHIIPELDSGTFDANTVAVVSKTVAGTIPPGLIWICVCTDGTPTVRTYNTTMQRFIGVQTAGGSSPFAGYYVDGVSVSSPPDVLGAGAYHGTLLAAQFRVV